MKLTEADRQIQEREANLFAMCLLIPEPFIRKELEEQGGFNPLSETQLQALAQRYQVSVSLMALRLADLGYMQL